MAITVEHPDQHAPTAEQLEEAGVDLDQVKGYRNESGVSTTYIFEGEDLETVLDEGEGESAPEPENVPEPAPTTRRNRANSQPVGTTATAEPPA